MSSTEQARHVSRAQLHAYARGEVDPARRSVVEAHLAACEECRAHLRQVREVTDLLSEMGTVDLDDLRWRRIRDAVRQQLEVDAQQPPQDIMVGRRWVIPAVAASLVVALMVGTAVVMRRTSLVPTDIKPSRPGFVTSSPGSQVGAPDHVDAPLGSPASGHVDSSDEAALRATRANGDAQHLVSGAAPLTVTLASGARLDLEPRTQMQAHVSDGPAVELALTVGAVRVRLPEPPTHGAEPNLQTPAFRLLAQSDDFSTGYWADRYFVEVRRGQVMVTGGDFGAAKLVIKAGQRRDVHRAPATEPGDMEARKTEADKTETGKTEAGKTDAPSLRPLQPKRRKTKHTAGATTASASRPVGRSLRWPGTFAASSSTEVFAKSEEGSVTVDVESPDDPGLTLWRQTIDAYYRERDLAKAVRLADQVIQTGGERARMAQQLLCDAQIGLEQGAEALEACSALLDARATAEERRNIHYTLGTIYRALLGDCRQAIEHYNRAVVFGRQNILDEKVRLSRATCALEVGDLAVAERDIASLSSRRKDGAGRLARPEEVTLLQRKLAAAKRALKAAAQPTD